MPIFANIRPLDIFATVGGSLLKFSGSGFDATRVFDPAVTVVGNVDYMLFGALPFGNNMQIGLATSTNGVTWAVSAGSPVISNAGSPTWDSFREVPVSLMYENGVWKAWFNGDNTNLSTASGAIEGFGYATSTNGGETWVQGSNPIRSGLNALGQGVDLLEMVKLNGEYIAYYVQNAASGPVYYRAISTDGMNFTGDSALSGPVGEVLTAATTVMYNGQQAILSVWAASDGSQQWALSTDGVHFAIEGTINLPTPFVITDVDVVGNRINFYGSLSVGNVNWAYGNTDIEYASALLPTGISAIQSNPNNAEYYNAANAVYDDNFPGAGNNTAPNENLTGLTLVADSRNYSYSSLNSPLSHFVDNPFFSQNGLSDGFFAQAFMDSSHNIILAFEGSLFSGPEAQTQYGFMTRVADGDLYAHDSIPDPILSDALEFLADIEKSDTSSNPIYLTGHSLGGAIAEYVASYSGLSGVSFGAPGVAYLPHANLASGQTFTDFVDWGDPVGNFSGGSHFGSVTRVGLISDNIGNSYADELVEAETFHPLKNYAQALTLNLPPGLSGYAVTA